MEGSKPTTEEQILEAAEQVFLNKGFRNSKISDIAELAGVNNALINYYFRSKENLFNKVLHNKIELLAKSIIYVVDQELSFEKMIENLVGAQFDFFKENESLPRFILSEILPDESRINTFRNNLIPVILHAGTQLDKRLQKEVKTGNIRNINLFELLYIMTSLNVLCFAIKPIIVGTGANSITAHFSEVLGDRKTKNIKIVMNYLKN
jgi:AcrR family transcriptional regulator